jgi:aminopeptidase N
MPTTFRRDYTPPPVIVEHIRLEFVLSAQHTIVKATSKMRRQSSITAGLQTELSALPFDLHLSGDGQRLRACTVNGINAGRVLGNDLAVNIAADEFELYCETEINPQDNSSLMGLYVSNGNYFTQCEAEGFRKITYFLDRPDVMTKFTVVLHAEQSLCPVLLSNGNLIAQGLSTNKPGWHWAEWHDPFPKPSYLFALVAGKLIANEETIVQPSGSKALLQVWVEPGNEDKTDYAMQSLKKSIAWDQQRFGLELDLERFMIVAVSDFNMGAMENKGLNIFNTKFVFANPWLATDADFANVESVVGHEYFHNWTGNRVTCRDWFQLTLKEGLTVFRDQEFSADMVAAQTGRSSARSVKRIEDVRVLRSMQFPEDAGPMAHPIRPDSYEEINNFYTVTIYEKGAEVIRMLHTLVGEAGFRKGMDLYFQRHDGQAVTCDDFMASIADANQRDLTLFSTWYSHAGTPRLQVTDRYDAAKKTYRISFKQLGASVFHIPVRMGLLGKDGKDLENSQRLLELTEAEHTFTFENIASKPTPSIFRDFSAPVYCHFPYSDDDLAFLATNDSDLFNRWDALQQLCTRVMVTAAKEHKAVWAELAAPVIAIYSAAIGEALGPNRLDASYTELFLTLPTEGILSEQLDVVEPDYIRIARNSFKVIIANALSAQWQALYLQERAHHGNKNLSDFQNTPLAAGKRALAGLALGYWVLTGQSSASQAALDQLTTSNNMTDKLSAMNALAQLPSHHFADGLRVFENEYYNEALAMDKWFLLQAQLHFNALDKVKLLMEHPRFSMKNPNKVRSLLGAFFSGNLGEFHKSDGSGYEFWVAQVLALDNINPQVAARLARALDRWRRFEPMRQTSMRKALETVKTRAKSPDVLEIISKALA